MPRGTFEDWMKKVDEAVEALTGMSEEDLPDWDAYDIWADGATPAEGAQIAIDQAGGL